MQPAGIFFEFQQSDAQIAIILLDFFVIFRAKRKKSYLGGR